MTVTLSAQFQPDDPECPILAYRIEKVTSTGGLDIQQNAYQNLLSISNDGALAISDFT